MPTEEDDLKCGSKAKNLFLFDHSETDLIQTQHIYKGYNFFDIFQLIQIFGWNCVQGFLCAERAPLHIQTISSYCEHSQQGEQRKKPKMKSDRL